jgi:hypothetical protein
MSIDDDDPEWECDTCEDEGVIDCPECKDDIEERFDCETCGGSGCVECPSCGYDDPDDDWEGNEDW